MTGRQWTTVSPSSTSSSRSTPCVDGCCGPMSMVSSSRSSVRAINPSRDREVDRLTTQWLGSSQGVALPVVGQHDPLQIWMALELDAKQVEDFAFIPVRAWHERRNTRRVLVGARLEPQPRVRVQRIEQVDE